MPYIKKEFKSIKDLSIEEFLLHHTNLDESLVLNLLKKGKILDENNKRFQQNQLIKCEKIYITIFEPQSKNLKPIFQNRYFAIFDKPSGVLVHPTSSNDFSYTLLDEIKFHLGNDASLIHRIDRETSGLVLVAIDKYSELILKSLFEDKTLNNNSNIKKTYIALVNGHLKEKLTINEPISNSTGKIKIKMQVSKEGKTSKTIINPIEYYKEKNQTLIQATPITGRQHQIRVHCDYIGHNIVGDPIYGVEEEIANEYLNKTIKKDQRLMLQANSLEFCFLGTTYKFKSLLKLS